MSSTCFVNEGPSSGRRLYMQFWYGAFYMSRYLLLTILLILMHVRGTVPYHNCIYYCLPEDEPSGSKHVNDIKIKNENNLENVHFVGLGFKMV
jgi:hypothetical protein